MELQEDSKTTNEPPIQLEFHWRDNINEKTPVKILGSQRFHSTYRKADCSWTRKLGPCWPKVCLPLSMPLIIINMRKYNKIEPNPKITAITYISATQIQPNLRLNLNFIKIWDWAKNHYIMSIRKKRNHIDPLISIYPSCMHPLSKI